MFGFSSLAVAGFAVLVGLALVLVSGVVVTAWAAMTDRPRVIRRGLIIPALLLYAPLQHRRWIGATGAVLSGLGAWDFFLGAKIGPAASFFVLLTVIQALYALQYVLYGCCRAGGSRHELDGAHP